MAIFVRSSAGTVTFKEFTNKKDITNLFRSINFTSISTNPANDNILAIVKNQFISFNLIEMMSTQIENFGVICSTIENPISGVEILKLSCSDNLLSLKRTIGPFYVECPLNCHLSQNLKIFGSLIYKADSSICKSAIHSGFFNISSKLDGENIVQVIPTVNSGNYEGKEQNSIQSYEFKIFDDKSDNKIAFIVNPIVEECPNNVLQDEYQSFFRKNNNVSFFEFDEIVNFTEKNSKGKKIKMDNQNKTNLIESIKQLVAIKSEFKKMDLVSQMSENPGNLFLHLFENYERNLKLNLRNLLLFNENLKFKENFGKYLINEFDSLSDKSDLIAKWNEKSYFWLNLVPRNLKTGLSNLLK